MQQLKSSVRRFWNAMQRQKAETAMKFRAGHSIFFENIAEGPVGIPIYLSLIHIFIAFCGEGSPVECKRDIPIWNCFRNTFIFSPCGI